VDPLAGLRSVRRRMTDPLESAAQAIAERVIDLVVHALDVNALLARADINSVAARIDIDALVGQTDLGAVIARSSGSVASGTVDIMRSQAFNIDELIARCAARLLRRRYQGPPGPPKMSRVATKP
jgi:hypothetical protein